MTTVIVPKADCAAPGTASSLLVVSGDESRARAEEHEARASLSLWIFWLPPAVMTFLVYSVRWALTGKIKPLWILAGTNRHAATDQ